MADSIPANQKPEVQDSTMQTSEIPSNDLLWYRSRSVTPSNNESNIIIWFYTLIGYHHKHGDPIFEYFEVFLFGYFGIPVPGSWLWYHRYQVQITADCCSSRNFMKLFAVWNMYASSRLLMYWHYHHHYNTDWLLRVHSLHEEGGGNLLLAIVPGWLMQHCWCGVCLFAVPPLAVFQPPHRPMALFLCSKQQIKAVRLVLQYGRRTSLFSLLPFFFPVPVQQDSSTGSTHLLK